MSNSTCTLYGNCTIMDGPVTNGTFYIIGYDPKAHPPYWHQDLELAIICVFNSLSVILICARTAYRWIKFHRFRGDDRWMAAAGVCIVTYTVSQIYSNRAGSGLHNKNIKDPWLKLHWESEFGWIGYYISVTLIKISVCFTFMEILPRNFKALRWTVYGLMALITSLGIILSISWLFQCKPVLSNFLWNIDSTSCVNYDYFRWTWIGFSLSIDLMILAVPWQILKRTLLKEHERKVLRLMFSANLLGTLACALGIYGVWETRTGGINDGFYNEALFLMFNDIEMFMYALGASLPVLSRQIVARSDPSRGSHANFSSWARSVPDFFTPLQPVALRTRRNSIPSDSRFGSHISVQSLNGLDELGREHEHHLEKGPERPDF